MGSGVPSYPSGRASDGKDMEHETEAGLSKDFQQKWSQMQARVFNTLLQLLPSREPGVT